MPYGHQNTNKGKHKAHCNCTAIKLATLTNVERYAAMRQVTITSWIMHVSAVLDLHLQWKKPKQHLSVFTMLQQAAQTNQQNQRKSAFQHVIQHLHKLLCKQQARNPILQTIVCPQCCQHQKPHAKQLQ